MEQHPQTVAGDVHDGDAVYAVKLHETGLDQLNRPVQLLSNQIRAESAVILTWMTLQFLVIVALLLLLIF